MEQWARCGGSEVVRLSAGLSARFVHDAGAQGAMVHVTSPRTFLTLEQGFRRLLRDTRRPVVLQVPARIAAGLQRSGERQCPAAETYTLALAFDRHGRGTFLLRPDPADGSVATSVQVEQEMRRELANHLARVSALPKDEPQSEDPE